MAPRDGGKVEHLDGERQETGEGEPLEREPRAVAGIHYPVRKSPSADPDSEPPDVLDVVPRADEGSSCIG